MGIFEKYFHRYAYENFVTVCLFLAGKFNKELEELSSIHRGFSPTILKFSHEKKDIMYFHFSDNPLLHRDRLLSITNKFPLK
jgi:hypothetical protein